MCGSWYTAAGLYDLGMSIDLPGQPGPDVDINHPRQLLVMWRDEANRLATHITANPDGHWEGGQAVVVTLQRCARMLEDRLKWSGLS